MGHVPKPTYKLHESTRDIAGVDRTRALYTLVVWHESGQTDLNMIDIRPLSQKTLFERAVLQLRRDDERIGSVLIVCWIDEILLVGDVQSRSQTTRSIIAGEIKHEERRGFQLAETLLWKVSPNLTEQGICYLGQPVAGKPRAVLCRRSSLPRATLIHPDAKADSTRTASFHV